MELPLGTAAESLEAPCVSCYHVRTMIITYLGGEAVKIQFGDTLVVNPGSLSGDKPRMAFIELGEEIFVDFRCFQAANVYECRGCKPLVPRLP